MTLATREYETTWADVERAQAGDAEAFGQIYRDHIDQVRKFVRYRVKCRETAEDLTSDVFVRALRNIGRVVDQGKPIGAWLITIAKNIVADHYKSSRVRLETTCPFDALNLDDHDDNFDEKVNYDSPERLVMAYLDNVELWGLVTDLSPDQQEVLALRFIRGLTVGETARVMGRNVGAVKALQFRATGALRRAMPDSRWTS